MLVIDIILIEHAVRINEHYIIFFTTILFSLSVSEILIVLSEIHMNYQKNNILKSLSGKISKFTENKKGRNVKILVSQFIDRHPEYSPNRDEIYQIMCKILRDQKQTNPGEKQNKR
ncbi:hypothetical protein AYK25_01705 [Thermoplasmatales archaeon SM1-50]|nr:MAG: hypothetical protein AYK25_01705 [Thermoplasmatales archaeon SM1-50]